jgi:hypothetical protein
MKYLATAGHGPVLAPVNAALAGLVLGLLASVLERFGKFPLWIPVVACVVGSFAVAAWTRYQGHGWRISVARLVSLDIVTLWPIWYAKSESPLLPLLALFLIALVMPLIHPDLVAARENVVAAGRVTQVSDVRGDVRIGSEPDPARTAGGPFDGVTIGLVDVVAEAVEMYGGRESAEAIVGRELPDRDWRFEITYRGRSPFAMFQGATAEQVVTLINRDREEGRFGQRP